jgi:predicted Fe-Mo cluster-binding NifX family protein
MKIGISATGKTLDAEVDPRFGRCQYFIIADIDTDDFEAVDNSSATAAGGAGISAAQMVVQKGVEAVLTGNCGPNAHQVFSSAGVKVITGVSGKVKDAIAEYKLGTYSVAQQANVPDHYGMGGGGGAGRGMGGGMGRGMGMGRGIGGGGGKGMGMGRGMGMGGGIMSFSTPTPQSSSPEQEIEALKVQSQALAEQLAGIQQRIEKLSEKKDSK